MAENRYVQTSQLERFFDAIILLYIFAFAFLSKTPFFQEMLGFRGRVWFFFSLIPIFLLLILRGGKVPIWLVIFVVISLVCSIITIMGTGSTLSIQATILMLLGVSLSSLILSKHVDALIAISTWFIFVILLGAWIGFFISTIGIDPLFIFTRLEDSNYWYWFYTTFSKNHLANIRATGIYHEPGAFSFFVCGVAALRHLKGYDKKITWTILLGGLITLSLAHLIYIPFHFFSEKFSFKFIIRVFCLLCAVFFLASISGFLDDLTNRLFSRLTNVENESKIVAGDNRTRRLINAFNLLKTEKNIIVFGSSGKYSSIKEEYGSTNANPLTPIVSYGIITAWPYYILLGLMLLFPFRSEGKHYLVVAAFGFLLMQRPYLFGYGYSFVFVLLYLIARTDYSKFSLKRTSIIKRALHAAQS